MALARTREQCSLRVRRCDDESSRAIRSRTCEHARQTFERHVILSYLTSPALAGERVYLTRADTA